MRSGSLYIRTVYFNNMKLDEKLVKVLTNESGIVTFRAGNKDSFERLQVKLSDIPKKSINIDNDILKIIYTKT